MSLLHIKTIIGTNRSALASINRLGMIEFVRDDLSDPAERARRVLKHRAIHYKTLSCARDFDLTMRYLELRHHDEIALRRGVRNSADRPYDDAAKRGRKHDGSRYHSGMSPHLS